MRMIEALNAAAGAAGRDEREKRPGKGPALVVRIGRSAAVGGAEGVEELDDAGQERACSPSLRKRATRVLEEGKLPLAVRLPHG